jgi:hypothetical protein
MPENLARRSRGWLKLGRLQMNGWLKLGRPHSTADSRRERRDLRRSHWKRRLRNFGL